MGLKLSQFFGVSYYTAQFFSKTLLVIIVFFHATSTGQPQYNESLCVSVDSPPMMYGT